MSTSLVERRVLLILFLAVCVLVPSIYLAADAKTVTLVGVIEGVEFDDDGNPGAVAVSDDEMGWVLISQAGKGAELLSHIGATAEIMGTLKESSEDDEYDYVITVSKYSILKNAEENDDADMGDEPDDDDEGGGN